MTEKLLPITSAVLAAALASTAPSQSLAAEGGIKAGVLTCDVDSGWGFVFGSSRSLRCTYSPNQGTGEHYSGSISKFGVDIGYVQGGVIVWTVLAPTTDLAPGSLAGDYGGATGGASVGVGVGANALLGGSEKGIVLQPLSLEGNVGLNVAAGIAALKLKSES